MINMEKNDLGNNIFIYKNFYNNNDFLYNLIKTININWKFTQAIDYDINSISKRNNAAKASFSHLYEIEQKGVKAEIVKLESNFAKIFLDCFNNSDSTFSWYDDVQIIRYLKHSFFKRHSDNTLNENQMYSVFYYLNDDYEGGELYFPNFELTISPESNSVIVFPSEYIHQVNEIINGERYVIGMFIR